MVSLLLDPVTLICFCLCVLTWYLYRHTNVQATVISACVLILNILLASPMIANGLTYILEGQRGALVCKAKIPDIIVVLGGGLRSGNISTKMETGNLHIASFRRTQGALRLAKKHPFLKVIISGGSGTKDVTEADLMSVLLQQQGIDIARIIKERESVNTWESSSKTALILEKKKYKYIYLVTSALHMPRAIRTYKKLKFDVCAYPVDRVFIKPKWSEMLIPQMSAFVKTKNAFHEMGGIVWYYLSGKI